MGAQKGRVRSPNDRTARRIFDVIPMICGSGTGHLWFLKKTYVFPNSSWYEKCVLWKFLPQFWKCHLIFFKDISSPIFHVIPETFCFVLFFMFQDVFGCFFPRVPAFHPRALIWKHLKSRCFLEDFVPSYIQGSKDKPSTKRVLGNTPAPTTTQSAGKTSPSSNSTPFTASFPRNKRTWEVPNHSTPAQELVNRILGGIRWEKVDDS